MTSSSVYGNPRAYDLLFSYRDYPKEIATLVQWYTVATGADRAPGSVLELACGPARHAVEFSRNSIQVTGLDLSQEMCAYAESLAREAGTAVRLEQADMTDFDLGEGFDLVILMLNSIHYILDEQALSCHFRSVSRPLSESGIYMVEVDLAEPEEETRHLKVNWSAENGHDRIETWWEYDPDVQLEIASVIGTVAGEDINIEHRFPIRRWELGELSTAAGSAGLSLSAHYGNAALVGTENLALSHGGELHPCTCWRK